MSTYLLIWNPKSWDWKDFEKSLTEIDLEGTFRMRWSTGVTKKIVEGDRCFLMHLGKEPKAIVGSGFFTSKPTLGPHWNGEQGRQCLYSGVELDVLAYPTSTEALPLKVLSKHCPDFNWTPQASGQSIPDPTAKKLESLWKKRLESQKIAQLPLWEGALWRVITNRRERSALARQECIQHYGLHCVICKFNFQQAYGDIGEGIIHVHHLEQLSSSNKSRCVDPVRDMRPVCANCHLIIHKRKIPLTIEEMQSLVRKQKS